MLVKLLIKHPESEHVGNEGYTTLTSTKPTLSLIYASCVIFFILSV